MAISFSNRSARRLAVLLLAALLLGWQLFSPYGGLRYYRISRDLRQIREKNQQLRAENQALRTEIAKLRNDPAYLEEVARRRFGLIRRNELLFDFSKKKKRKKTR